MVEKGIQLFISDIDGCLAEPFRPFNLDGLQELRRIAVTERESNSPRLTICTGRPLSYVEAMVQAIGFEMPVLFEAGGAMYDPTSYSVRWAPEVTSEQRQIVSDIVRFWEDRYLHDDDISIDYGKLTQASIVIRNEDKMRWMLPEITETIRSKYQGMVVADTHVSIDVLPDGLTKAQGVAWLVNELGIDLERTGFIGDSTGDIGAIRAVGFGCAPANASEAVKEHADYVCEGRHIEGVIEAYRMCIPGSGDPG